MWYARLHADDDRPDLVELRRERVRVHDAFLAGAREREQWRLEQKAISRRILTKLRYYDDRALWDMVDDVWFSLDEHAMRTQWALTREAGASLRDEITRVWERYRADVLRTDNLFDE